MNIENLMAIKSEDGTSSEIMGKFLYYSFPKLMIDKERLKEICESVSFPVMVREKTSLTDAFRSATSDINDRIVENDGDVINIYRIYCRDNKRISNENVSRELVEETLDTDTNQYNKLANIILDKPSGSVHVVHYDFSGRRDVDAYCDKAKDLFDLYQRCVLSRQIETLAEKYVAAMNSIKVGTRGHHYFVPKSHMHMIDVLEDFMEALSTNNLFTPINQSVSNMISVNSMYVADSKKQRQKMTAEFYVDIGKQIRDYQDRIDRLIKSGNESQAIFDRWILKVESLEQKKLDYEKILKQNLDGVDEEFQLLNTLCAEYRLRINSSLKNAA